MVPSVSRPHLLTCPGPYWAFSHVSVPFLKLLWLYWMLILILNSLHDGQWHTLLKPALRRQISVSSRPAWSRVPGQPGYTQKIPVSKNRVCVCVCKGGYRTTYYRTGRVKGGGSRVQECLQNEYQANLSFIERPIQRKREKKLWKSVMMIQTHNSRS